jgi:acetyltransferase
MTARNLEKIFAPQNIAVIGASNRPGSVGYVLFNNLINSGYQGIVFPVNPKYKSMQGVRAFWVPCCLGDIIFPVVLAESEK